MSLETETSPIELESGEEEKSRIPADWESRLAIARAKREKALSQKVNTPKKKRVNRPPMSLSDVDDFEEAKTAFLASDDEKPIAPPIAVAPARETPKAPVKETAKKTLPAATVSLPEEPRKKRFNQLGLVLVSCCVGLGFGFALGLGLLIGSGWVTPQQVWRTETELSKAPVQTKVIEPLQPAVIQEAAKIKPKLPAEVKPNPAPLVIAKPVIVETSPVVSLSTPTLKNVTYTPSSFRFGEIASVHRPAFAALPAQAKADLPLEQARHTDSTIPVTSLAVNSLGPVNQSDAVPHLPNSEIRYASTEQNPFRLPAPSKMGVFFAHPASGQNPGVVQPEIQNLASPETIFAAPARPADETTLLSQFSLPAQLQPVHNDLQLPKADQPSILLNFAQAIGLPAATAEEFDLVLLAPAAVKDQDITNFETVLGKTGLPLSKTVKVGFNISNPHIRYYDIESKNIAESLAQSMGIGARDFISNGIGSGQIEVWMASDSVYEPSVQVTNLKKFSPRTKIRTELSNNIIKGLKIANN